jgi:hypothetical protein
MSRSYTSSPPSTSKACSGTALLCTFFLLHLMSIVLIPRFFINWASLMATVSGATYCGVIFGGYMLLSLIFLYALKFQAQICFKLREEAFRLISYVSIRKAQNADLYFHTIYFSIQNFSNQKDVKLA